MHETVVALSPRRSALLVAVGNIGRARRLLELHGNDGVDEACWHLEDVIARLRPLASDAELPVDVRRAAERCRATLSSHLLAAENLDGAGCPPATVLSLLRRGVAAGEAAAAQAAFGPDYHAS